MSDQTSAISAGDLVDAVAFARHAIAHARDVAPADVVRLANQVIRLAGLPERPAMHAKGRRGYEAYSAHTGGRSLATGDPLPAWDALRPAIQEAWQVAAAAILRGPEPPTPPRYLRCNCAAIAAARSERLGPGADVPPCQIHSDREFCQHLDGFICYHCGRRVDDD